MHFARNPLLAALAAGALATACAGQTEGEPPPPAAGQDVRVNVTPPSAQLGAGEKVTFAAAVTGTADTRVTWTVVETGGGTVDANGAYVAPAAPGGYHVRAVSVANSAVSAQATVTVVPPLTVTISPRTPSVVAGGTITFTATVANATNAGVTWSVSGASCGTITAAGVYTAPGAAGTCSVVATSQQDPTRTDTTTVTVTAPAPAVAVTVTPSPASVDACKTVQLTATVTNATNKAVTWSVQEGAAGGTVSTAGLFTAPSTAGTYHVVATSVADPSKSAVTTMTVSDKILSIALSPSTISVAPGGTAQFTATVTTTCGAFASTSTVTAP